MKKAALTVLAVFSIALISFAQPGIQWQKSLGSNMGDYFNSMIATSDGGYLLVGNASADNADVTGLHGSTDFWIVKLDADGTLLWQKCFGGTGPDEATCVTEVSGGYIIAGYTASYDDDVFGNHDTISMLSTDAWVIKINTSGSLLWQKCFGGMSADVARGIKLLPSGDLIVSAFSSSTDGDLAGGINLQAAVNAWIFKISATGNLIWSKCYGGGGNDELPSIVLADNGNLMLAGTTTSDSGDVSGNHGAEDVWLVKLNSAGDLLWKKCYGGSLKDYGYSMVKSDDNNFVISGNTFSNDFDVSGNHSVPDSNDVWVIKVDTAGALLWERCYGGTANDNAKNILALPNGNFLVTATTNSINGDVTGIHGTADYWIMKLDFLGNIFWQKCLGGSNYDFALESVVTNSTEYTIGGWSYSNDGDATSNNGSADYWIVKLDPNLTIGINESQNDNSIVTVYPNPSSGNFTLKFDHEIKSGAIKITDIQGKIILETGIANEIEKNISSMNIAKGSYFVSIFDGDISYVNKLFIK